MNLIWFHSVCNIGITPAGVKITQASILKQTVLQISLKEKCTLHNNDKVTRA